MEKLSSVLAELAQKLNVGVDVLWAAMITQARIEAIVTTIQFVLLIVAVWYWAKRLRWSFEEVTYDSRYEQNRKGSRWDKWGYENEGKPIVIGVIFTVLGIIMLVLLILSFCLLSTYFSSIFNPEYWALQKILGH